jgi:peptide/nickel transport system ATP-binding protein
VSEPGSELMRFQGPPAGAPSREREATAASVESPAHAAVRERERDAVAAQSVESPAGAAVPGQDAAPASAPSTAPLLRVEGLSVQIPTEAGVVRAVECVDFEIARGRALGIVGESGSGKTVASLALLGLLGPAAHVTGRAEFEGRDLLTLAPRELRALRGAEIAMVFQDPLAALHPLHRVGWQIVEAIRAHRSLSRERARTRAVELLELVGIPEPHRRVRAYPHELSGGQRQRAMIAMALANEPRLLIADEPTTALDVTVQAQILELLGRLRRELNMALVLIAHDLAVVAQVADEVLVMRAGRVLEHGRTEDVFASPSAAYTRALLDASPRLDDPLQPRARLPLAASGAPQSSSPLAAPGVSRPSPPLAASGVPQPSPAPAAPGGPQPSPPRATSGAQQPLLEVRGLVKHFPPRGVMARRRGAAAVCAVDGVSFAVMPGEALGLVGETGCGKSTTARLIMRLLDASAGEIRFAGREIAGLRGEPLRALRRELQIVFQDPYSSLNPRRTVGAIVAEPLAIHKLEDGPAARRRRVQELLEMVGLDARYGARYPHELSGGQRQRIGIARALALEPKLLIADEPVSSLDVQVQAQILDLLRRLQCEFGLALLFISHDLAVVRHMCERVAVMNAGRIVECGPVADLYEHPRDPYTRELLAAVPKLPGDRRTISA